MKSTSLYLVALGLAAAGLSSCGRSTYSFQSTAPAYLGTTPAAVAALPAPGATSAVVIASARPAAISASRVASPVVLPPAGARPAETTLLALAATPAPGRRLPAGQRLLLARVLKQATQATTHPQKQHTASVAAKPGVKAYLTVLLVGLVGVAIGLIASSSFLIVVGSIVTIVGILLLILRSIYA